MRANVEPLEGNKVKLTVELEEQEIDQAIDAAFRKIARQVNIPGFRPGKAPRRLIEARVGIETARAQALHDSIPDYYIKAIRETGTDPIESPDVKITEGEEEGSTVVFEAEVNVRPVPDIAGYQGLKVVIPNPVPTDEDIDAQIDRMRANDGELVDVDRPAQEGDFVTIDFSGTREGEPVPGLSATDFSYEVGNEFQSLGPDFDGKINGAKVGDVIDFTSPVPPNDEETDFHIEVKKVQERQLPELNDEWANEVSEFETVDALRADLADRMKEVRKVEANRALRNGAIEAIAELVDEEPPDALVQNEMQKVLSDFVYRLQSQGIELAQYLQLTGQDQEEFAAQIRDNAIASVNADLALRALADKESLDATDEEVETQIQMLAEQYGEKAAKLRRELERVDDLTGVRSDIRKGKAVRWLMDNVEVVDADGTAIDRDALRFDIGAQNEDGHDHTDQEGE